MQTTIKIYFFSDWHISSGVGDGYFLDSVLCRDRDGFPFIPGRTLKGVLRYGANRLGICRPDLKNAENFFWVEHSNHANYNTLAGMRISSAHFSDGLKQQLFNHSNIQQFISDLTLVRTNTALTEEFISKRSSLHNYECGMQGLELYANLRVDPCEGISDSWLESYFGAVCAMVKSIGADINRGLGRCKISLLNQKEPVVLPQENAFLMQFGAR